MRVSKDCISIVKHYEGCKLEAYICPAGKATIGYGNTFYPPQMHFAHKEVRMGDHITQEQADTMLSIVLDGFAEQVRPLLKVEVKQQEFDALVDFAYNCGIGNLSTSTLLKKVNEKAPLEEVKAEFMKWNKGGGKELKGLTSRRHTEATLYETGKVVFY